MTNFNTYQTRQFYVGTKATDVEDNLDIALKQAETGEMYFVYKNADGIVTRSDSFDPKKIVSLKDTAAAKMARKLKMHTVAIDTSAVTLSELVGKTLDLIITFHGVIDYDMDSTVTFIASVVGNSTNTASATAFHKALAGAVALALPKTPEPLLKVFSNGSEVTKAIAKAGSQTGAAAGVVLVEAASKYVRGKLSGEPVPFSVAFRLHDSNVEDVIWGTDTVADSNIANNTVVPANYILADLEYFALGERGDIYRGNNWPYNYEPTYVINPFGNTVYNVLSIEYYWQGGAENVQKSPRMIQIAGSSSDTAAFKTAIEDAINGGASEGNVGQG